jgi:hypothetical protein
MASIRQRSRPLPRLRLTHILALAMGTPDFTAIADKFVYYAELSRVYAARSRDSVIQTRLLAQAELFELQAAQVLEDARVVAASEALMQTVSVLLARR